MIYLTILAIAALGGAAAIIAANFTAPPRGGWPTRSGTAPLDLIDRLPDWLRARLPRSRVQQLTATGTAPDIARRMAAAEHRRRVAYWRRRIAARAAQGQRWRYPVSAAPWWAAALLAVALLAALLLIAAPAQAATAAGVDVVDALHQHPAALVAVAVVAVAVKVARVAGRRRRWSAARRESCRLEQRLRADRWQARHRMNNSVAGYTSPALAASLAAAGVAMLAALHWPALTGAGLVALAAAGVAAAVHGGQNTAANGQRGALGAAVETWTIEERDAFGAWRPVEWWQGDTAKVAAREYAEQAHDCGVKCTKPSDSEPDRPADFRIADGCGTAALNCHLLPRDGGGMVGGNPDPLTHAGESWLGYLECDTPNIRYCATLADALAALD